MHSSRMRTGRSLTICCSLLPGWGGVWSRGVWSLGVSGPVGGCGVCSGGGVWSGGVCLLHGGGVWSEGSGPGGSAPREGQLPGGLVLGGLLLGEWYPSMH